MYLGGGDLDNIVTTINGTVMDVINLDKRIGNNDKLITSTMNNLSKTTETVNTNVKNISSHSNDGAKHITDIERKNLDTAYSHSNNTTNPHQVTKTQVGLSNVPNVTTNNQKPTFTQASILDNIISGDTLTILLGKISKAIADLITHIGDKVLHITATERTNWNDANTKKHTHSNKAIIDKVTQTMLDKLAGIADGANKYTHPTTTGNKHIPSGGATNQILKWSADGTAVWGIQTSVTGNAGTATKWATARNINGLSIQGDANRVNYGICSTAGDVAEKIIPCPGFALITGAEIVVKFELSNTVKSFTFNVNGTGAKTVCYRGVPIGETNMYGYFAANRTYAFRYDGTKYDCVGDLNTNTKTTTGAKNSSSKLFLVGALKQEESPTTYTHDTAYVGTDGCLYSNNKKVSTTDHFHRRMVFVGSDKVNANGWYKICSRTFTQYQNCNITFMVTSTYGDNYFGILQLQMRSEVDVLYCQAIKWLVRYGFASNSVRVNITGMTFTLYMNRVKTRYGRLMFEILSESSIGGMNSGITLYNNNYVKEVTDPVATATSTDGGVVYRANHADDVVKLRTARTINGTSFNGTANITTVKWGTARAIKIGNASKNIDGSENVTFSLAEIGVGGSSKNISCTATVSKWTGTAAPFTQVITVSGVSTNANILVGLGKSTLAQEEMAGKCIIRCTAQGENQITLSALKKKPTIDLPINVLIIG